MREPLLLTPGPTIVPPQVREALARPMIHHRTPAFQAILKETAEGLKTLFGTAQDVLILTSSGTGAMEAAVVNLFSPGEELLVIRGGKFGQRWDEICRAYGIRVVAVDPAWGKPLDVGELKVTLSKHPGVRAVLVTLCETSTGALYPIRQIREAIGERETLLVVDAVSGLGQEEFRMDAWGVDAAVAGSQKGTMLPPGLSYIALSPRAWARVESSKCPKYYFSLAAAREAWAQTDTPFTPGISLIVGLTESLRFILKDGLDRFIGRHQAQAEALRGKIQAMGLELYTDPACVSATVTAIKVPDGIDGKALVKKMRDEHGVSIAGGQGKELAGRIFRIASMGAVGPKELEAGLRALEEVLAQMGWRVKV